MTRKLATEKVSAWYGPKKAIEDISLDFEEHATTAIIGQNTNGRSSSPLSLGSTQARL